MEHIDKNTYLSDPKRYEIVSGEVNGAPLCPYGNKYRWVVIDNKTKEFVRLSHTAFKIAKNKSYE
ncbi:hypothetical protein [Crocinitomix algicola]|uniref:hypothetical protein n=1 Tax=Crocinitomix algicola TaxID=1740263 RepID=UPI000872AFF0|nr:hypothetical protein [Crocinitomix algicola]